MPGHLSTEPAPAADQRLISFATTNATLIAWLVFLGFGSAFLAFYYSHIHYFPELEWEQAFSYLAVASVLGGGLAAVYGLLLFVPGWIWSEFLIFDAELVRNRVLCYPARVSGAMDPCFWTISRYLVAPFAVMMALVHFALLTRSNLSFAFAAGIGVLFVATWSTSHLSKKVKKAAQRKKTSARQIHANGTSGAEAGSLPSFVWKYSLTTATACLTSIVSLFILSRLVDPKRESVLLLLICTTAVVVTNLLVAVQFRQRPGRAVITGIVAALLLMACGEMLAETGSSQSERIMGYFGVGTASHVSLNLTAEGVAHLARAGLDPNDVVLLSRLGEEYLVAGTSDFNKGRRAALKKNLVESWSSLDVTGDQEAAPFRLNATMVNLVLYAGFAACIVVIWPRLRPWLLMCWRQVGRWIASGRPIFVLPLVAARGVSRWLSRSRRHGSSLPSDSRASG